jgi:acyl-CoA thioester hydrolase
VYYEDTDSGGMVYHANYLKFMERARTEWLRALNFEQHELLDRYGILFAVRSVSVDFLKPARFNDRLQISVALQSCGKASLIFDQEVLRGAQTLQLLCKARVRIACLDHGTARPRAIPKQIMMEISDVG